MSKASRITRRAFLGRLAMASLAGRMAAQGAVRPGVRVIVIGAGVSGLAAAKMLHDSGVNVMVLEARDRMGGRIHTDRSTFGAPIEIGAQYVQGIKRADGEANPVWDMAKKHHWDSVSFSTDAAQAVRHGEEVDAAVISALFDDFVEAVAEAEDEIKPGHSVEDALAEYLSEAKLDDTKAMELRALVATQVGLEYGADIDEIAVQNIGDEDGFGGGNQILTGGYDQVPQLLAKGLDVRLGEAVGSIEYSDRGCKVWTAKGESYPADYVLCTLPLGVLKSDTVRFSPALPPAKSSAIARMGMGCLGKVFLEFPSRFWPEETNWFLSLKSSAPWGVAFSSLSRVIPGRHLLVMWQNGELARQREKLDDRKVVEIALAELRSALGEAPPAPIGALVTRWSSDPFSRGAYSYPRINSPKTDVAELAKPVDQRLFFAGEATSEGMFGTVPGAIFSGWREAKRIIELAQA